MVLFYIDMSHEVNVRKTKFWNQFSFFRVSNSDFIGSYYFSWNFSFQCLRKIIWGSLAQKLGEKIAPLARNLGLWFHSRSFTELWVAGCRLSAAVSAGLSLVDCQLSHWSTATAARQPGTGVSQARFPHLHLDLDQLLQDFLGIVLFLYSHPRSNGLWKFMWLSHNQD